VVVGGEGKIPPSCASLIAGHASKVIARATAIEHRKMTYLPEDNAVRFPAHRCKANRRAVGLQSRQTCNSAKKLSYMRAVKPVFKPIENT
jgi:hypothetical protein